MINFLRVFAALFFLMTSASVLFADSNAEANRLFTESMLLWKEQNSNDLEKSASFEVLSERSRALGEIKNNLESIVSNHSESDLSVKLVIGDVGGLSVESATKAKREVDSRILEQFCSYKITPQCIVEIASRILERLPQNIRKYAVLRLDVAQAEIGNIEAAVSHFDVSEIDHDLVGYYREFVPLIIANMATSGQIAEVNAFFDKLDPHTVLRAADGPIKDERELQKEIFRRILELGNPRAATDLLKQMDWYEGPLMHALIDKGNIEDALNILTNMDDSKEMTGAFWIFLFEVYKSGAGDKDLILSIADRVKRVAEDEYSITKDASGVARYYELKKGDLIAKVTQEEFRHMVEYEQAAVLYHLAISGKNSTIGTLLNSRDYPMDFGQFVIHWLIQQAEFEVAFSLLSEPNLLNEYQLSDIRNKFPIMVARQGHIELAYKMFEGHEFDNVGNKRYAFGELAYAAAASGKHDLAIESVFDEADPLTQFLGFLGVARGMSVQR